MREVRVPRYVTTKIIEDRHLQYTGRKGEDLTCRVRLFQTIHGYVLIVTDTGSYITDTIDRIATVMVRRWELDGRRVRVVEHYDNRNASDLAPGEPTETFALVGFDWDGMLATNPTWRAAVRADVEALIGDETLW